MTTKITTLQSFIDLTIQLSSKKLDWDVSIFMKRLHREILISLKETEIPSDVFIAYFKLHSLLGKRSSRQRIQSTVLGITDWLR